MSEIEFNEDTIGIAAGKIWQYLSENKQSNITKLKLALGMSNTIFYLALGWLAREDKIIINFTNNSYNVKLK